MVIADVAVMPLVPAATEDEVYECVDKVIHYIEQSGLKYEIGAMSTTIEGEYEKVFDLIKTIHRIPFDNGFERVITVVRIDEKKGGITIKEKLKNHI
ncbi:MTH1187 family thiamine-binding protein [Haloimpatiens sp. FM7330]|uniref:MTH1187 family thiamine-binding protein n=1 Tax=Haloimpatiens sp. FM7330 TaxID=3298610 RepID=UPI0036354662